MIVLVSFILAAIVLRLVLLMLPQRTYSIFRQIENVSLKEFSYRGEIVYKKRKR